MPLNSVLLRSTVVAALGGLLFGFDTVVISGTTQALTDLFHLSPLALGVTVSSALAGTIVGSMLAGIPGDAYGRRDSLRILAVLYFVSGVGWQRNGALTKRGKCFELQAKKIMNRNCRISSRRSMPTIPRAIRSSAASTAFPFFWPCRLPCSISSPELTRSFIT